jgi:general secretion pathway protein D
VTYQVADLVIPIPSVVHISNKAVSVDTTTVTQEEQLIKLITTTVEPKSWSDKGGLGTVDYHPLSKRLVINQTPDIQEQIHDLLSSLRRLQDRQVALEVRFISVNEDIDKKLIQKGLEGTQSKPADDSDPSLRVTVLSAEQASRLVEAVQEDRRSNLMQTPKMTTLSGQSAIFDVTKPESFVTALNFSTTSNGIPIFNPVVEEIPVGLRLTYRPTISDDNRSVNISLNVNRNELDDPKADTVPVLMPAFSQKENDGEPAERLTQLVQRPRINHLALNSTFDIADGKTALICGWKRERGVRTACDLPVLSDIPYLNKLFKNVSCTREKECVLMMVTPRIIIQEEEETRQTGFNLEQATQPAPQ